MAEQSSRSGFDPEGAGIAAVLQALDSGASTSEAVTGAYLSRIERLDRTGPAIHAVLAVNPDAIDQARAADRRRASGHPAGPLDGVPILVKDNIETADPVPTTAGSLALANNLTRRDAPLVARLRAAGAVILGKTNLSEWANMRDSHSISGWSGLGGLTRNPFSLDRSACGSSTGSAAAVAASFAPAAIGTETDGSVTCPAAVTGLVGLKPTVGLVSRSRVIPISASQDTAGPMTRTVRDAALLLGILAGSDPADPATRDADAHRTDYLAALKPDAPPANFLHGRRFGVLRVAAGYNPALDAVFSHALDLLRAQGAEIVEIPDFPGMDRIEADEKLVLLNELKTGLAHYLADTPVKNQPADLAALIRFNREHADRELVLFGQGQFEDAERTGGPQDPPYLQARDRARRAAGPDGIDRLLADGHLDALVAPTMAPAWTFDLVDGDNYAGSASTLPAVAGYPHLTVPMGTVTGLPVGLSIIGPAWSEAALLSLGYGFERAAAVRPRASFAPSLVSAAAADPRLVPFPH